MRSLNNLKGRIIKLYDQNHRVGTFEGKLYDYTCPSPKIYPHQWLWDSCFHAIVLSHFNVKRAEREITTLLLNQREDGFVPCVSIWKKRFPLEELFYFSKLTQCPVIPLAVEHIYNRNHDKNFVLDVYPKLKKFIKWFIDNRDNNKNRLIEIVHPMEDGDDGNPSFDKQMAFPEKPSTLEYFYSLFSKFYRRKSKFLAETVLFNSIFARSILSMYRLSKMLGNSTDSLEFKNEYEKVKTSLIENCWDDREQIFYDLDNNGKKSEVKSASSLMALMLPDLPKNIYEPLIKKHLLNPKEFWTPVPIASVSQDEKSFNPGRSFTLWRGPMWINTNWFLANALRNYGYPKEAEYVMKKSVEVVEKYGFWEFYNPFTGEGYGQPNYGWSALVLNMIL